MVSESEVYKIGFSIILIIFLIGMASYATNLLLKPDYSGKKYIEIYRVGDDRTCFYLNYPDNEVKVVAVGDSLGVEGVKYGTSTYQIDPNDVNDICYVPRPNDFSVGNFYHFEVWGDGEKIKSKSFEVSRLTTSIFYEPLQFFKDIWGRRLVKIGKTIDWATVTQKPTIMLMMGLILGGYIGGILSAVYLAILIWENRDELMRGGFSKSFPLLLASVWVIFDGFFSILIYPHQPWFPDHTMRVIRILIGFYLLMKVLK